MVLVSSVALVNACVLPGFSLKGSPRAALSSRPHFSFSRREVSSEPNRASQSSNAGNKTSTSSAFLSHSGRSPRCLSHGSRFAPSPLAGLLSGWRCLSKNFSPFSEIHQSNRRPQTSVFRLTAPALLVLLSHKVAANGGQNHLFGKIHTSAMGGWNGSAKIEGR